MKKLFVKILSVSLVAAVVMQDVSPFFSTKDTVVVALDKEEESKGKELEKQNDGKDKLFHDQLVYKVIMHDLSLYSTPHTCYKYPAYVSIPEIPPKQA